jgi:hypothetical protein
MISHACDVRFREICNEVPGEILIFVTVVASKTAHHALFFQAFYDCGGKFFSGLKRCEVPNARQSFKLVAREEMIELICPGNREDRIMLLPKNYCGCRKTVGWIGPLLLRVGGYGIP